MISHSSLKKIKTDTSLFLLSPTFFLIILTQLPLSCGIKFDLSRQTSYTFIFSLCTLIFTQISLTKLYMSTSVLGGTTYSSIILSFFMKFYLTISLKKNVSTLTVFPQLSIPRFSVREMNLDEATTQ